METVFGKLINRLESGFPIKCSKICYSTPVTYTEAAEGILDCVTQTKQADANTFHITGSQYANVFEILSRLSQNRGLNTELMTGWMDGSPDDTPLSRITLGFL